jgi:hypothetical protein
LTPAEAERERQILAAQAQIATWRARQQAEIDQLARTVEILQKGGATALQAYLIEHFEELMQPFAQTLALFPVEQTTVITGASGTHAPLSGIHPHPIEEEKARLLQQAFGVLGMSHHIETTPSNNNVG